MVQELEVDLEAFGGIFSAIQSSPFTVVEIDAASASTLAEQLGVPADINEHLRKPAVDRP